VCVQPVFAQGASDTENSLIGTGTSIIVENNYGYSGPLATEFGRSTAPGLERVDINRGGHGCHVVWRSAEIAPTVVPKLSLSTGLVYTYTKPAGASSDPWFLTALSFRTGKTVYRELAGDGLGYNNNYAPVTLGADGTAYVGVLGGLVEFRDATPPPAASAKAPAVRRRRRHRPPSHRWRHSPPRRG
jgi:outer membrane protein assembly factor BamB